MAKYKVDMELCAVISEYNPFHNGHKYQLEKIRELTKCDGIICIMSGDFVQRAEPAIMNKYSRARCALLGGADMVTELPVPFATANGELFAFGGVKIASLLYDVKYLAMGCETDSPDVLFTLAEIQATESDEFKTILKKNLDEGSTYPHAYAEATTVEAEKRGIDSDTSRIILSKPNNILCLNYIKALKKLNSDIQPVIIPRAETYTDNTGKSINTTSSSEVRRHMEKDGKLSHAEQYVPDFTLAELISSLTLSPLCRKTYSDIVMYTLQNLSLKEIKELPEVGEGLEYKLVSSALSATDIDSLLSLIKSKRYTEARLKRILLQSVLNITSGIMSDVITPYSHVLGIKQDFRQYLSKLSEDFYILSNENREMNAAQRRSVEIEKRASRLYSLLTHDSNYKYAHKLIVI